MDDKFSIFTFIVHAFSRNYRIRKQNVLRSYFHRNCLHKYCRLCLHSERMLFFNNCSFACRLTLNTSRLLAQKILSSFQCLLKGKLEILTDEKTAGFKCWSGYETNTLPRRSLQERILISGDLDVSEWQSVKPRSRSLEKNKNY